MLNCGLDEAGRGPLAGPVTAGCVILPPDFPLEILNDSKKLSQKKREEAEKIIKEKACWGIGIVDHETIDKINILQGAMYAMRLAWDMMILKLPDWAQSNGIELPSDIKSIIRATVDGTTLPGIDCMCKCEPKADANYPEVMAASILAKVERDRIMCEYDKQYPAYGYKNHMGYPTYRHKAVCIKAGPSPIQRLTFNLSLSQKEMEKLKNVWDRDFKSYDELSTLLEQEKSK